jgi:hypothetical protein
MWVKHAKGISDMDLVIYPTSLSPVWCLVGMRSMAPFWYILPLIYVFCRWTRSIILGLFCSLIIANIHSQTCEYSTSRRCQSHQVGIWVFLAEDPDIIEQEQSLLYPGGRAFRRWLSYEVRTLMSRVSVFIKKKKKVLRDIACPFCWCLTLDYPASRTLRNKLLLSMNSSLKYLVIVAWDIP